MNALTIKIPAALEDPLHSASQGLRLSRSELVRRAIKACLNQPASPPVAPSALALAGDGVGCFEGGPADLASNPKHLEGYGRR